MRIELRDESSSATCACCGNQTKTVLGYVYKNEIALAAYFVQWTHPTSDHSSNVDLLFSTWGDGSVNDKVLVSWIYNSNAAGGSFMVIDSHNRPVASSDVCVKSLSRDEVVNNKEIMSICAEVLDFVWLHDPRIVEITTFG